MAETLGSSDSIYHRLFAHPEMVADLLDHFLEPDALAELELSGMRRHNSKFTARRGGERRRADLVWEIPLRGGGSLFVLLILEFQSLIDEWMALRLDVYTGLLYQQLVDERGLKAEQGLPPVLPIVLYNGSSRWNAASTLRDLIRLPDSSPLWKYQPEMRYYIIDEGRVSEERLMHVPSLVAILFRMEHPGDPNAMMRAAQDVSTWFRTHPDGPPVKRLFRELLMTGLARLKLPDPLPPIPEDLQEMVNMLATHFEQWSNELERKGHQKGRQEANVEILLQLLQERFGVLPDSVRQQVNAAGLEDLTAWLGRLFKADSLQSIFK
ncbi:MAG: Rpn family recombination-promoting nuclease/putative transposase [Magnetococcales bacterium]|nr:Rpn family recombination-promoting nuclease/putative transposase [Magnetococcales bacterium]